MKMTVKPYLEIIILFDFIDLFILTNALIDLISVIDLIDCNKYIECEYVTDTASLSNHNKFLI